VGNFQLVVWAVVPPLLLLIYYYHRVPAAPSLPKLLLLFVVGAISGLVALDLELRFESLARWLVNWERITQSLPGVALRQLVEVGPIEEGSKLGSVVLLQGSRPKRTTTLFLFTTAVALGFTAEENWVYLANGTASILDRLIGTPVHAMFSAPWGYALGLARSSRFQSSGYRGLIVRAWLNAVICHALVNFLSSAWRYSPPLDLLSYGLFPFLVWMFWRLEGLLRRSQGKFPLALISGRKRIHYFWRLSLALFATTIGGNAIFGLFLLSRNLSPLSPSQLFSPHMRWFIVSRFGLNLITGLTAWGVYRYLRHSANRLD
jgi:RsiW-degrading membrane proteinase PrsW (M82 family)